MRKQFAYFKVRVRCDFYWVYILFGYSLQVKVKEEFPDWKHHRLQHSLIENEELSVPLESVLDESAGSDTY